MREIIHSIFLAWLSSVKSTSGGVCVIVDFVLVTWMKNEQENVNYGKIRNYSHSHVRCVSVCSAEATISLTRLKKIEKLHFPSDNRCHMAVFHHCYIAQWRNPFNLQSHQHWSLIISIYHSKVHQNKLMTNWRLEITAIIVSHYDGPFSIPFSLYL